VTVNQGSSTFTTDPADAFSCPTLKDLQWALDNTPEDGTLDLGSGSWSGALPPDNLNHHPGVLTIGHPMTLLNGTIHSPLYMSGLSIVWSDVTVDGLTGDRPAGHGIPWQGERL